MTEGIEGLKNGIKECIETIGQNSDMIRNMHKEISKLHNSKGIYFKTIIPGTNPEPVRVNEYEKYI